MPYFRGVLLQLPYAKNAGTGVVTATLIYATKIVSSRSAISDNAVVPPDTLLLEAWLRSDAPKATMNLTSIEHLLFDLIDRSFPAGRNLQHECWQCMRVISSAGVTDDRTASRAWGRLLRRTRRDEAGLLDETLQPQECLAAYLKYVDFLKSTQGLEPFAAPIAWLQSGWGVLGSRVVGNQVRIYTAFDLAGEVSDQQFVKRGAEVQISRK